MHSDCRPPPLSTTSCTASNSAATSRNTSDVTGAHSRVAAIFGRTRACRRKIASICGICCVTHEVVGGAGFHPAKPVCNRVFVSLLAGTLTESHSVGQPAILLGICLFALDQAN